MKTLFLSFCKRNLGYFRLAVISQLEYRVNFLTDALAQPILTSAIEMLLWFAVFKSTPKTQLAGFSREYYLSYALWAAFLARITSNWMYEFRMIQEIETGSVNAILSRPTTFFEYYLSQFMGYKLLTTVLSLLFPVILVLIFDLPTQFLRLLGALLLVVYYLVLVQVLSMCVCSLAYFFNRVSSFTMAKNLSLWLVSGELFPIDIAPPFLKNILLNLPFSSAVYIPVGYITGRISTDVLLKGFWNITWGLALFGVLALFLWKQGLKRYTGTGA